MSWGVGTVSSLTTLANVNHEEELESLVEGESIIMRGEEERREDEGEERGGEKTRREKGGQAEGKRGGGRRKEGGSIVFDPPFW